jgi:hypothetical protein
MGLELVIPLPSGVEKPLCFWLTCPPSTAIVTKIVFPNIADFNQQLSVGSFSKEFFKKEEHMVFSKHFSILPKCHKTLLFLSLKK